MRTVTTSHDNRLAIDHDLRFSFKLVKLEEKQREESMKISIALFLHNTERVLLRIREEMDLRIGS